MGTFIATRAGTIRGGVVVASSGMSQTLEQEQAGPLGARGQDRHPVRYDEKKPSDKAITSRTAHQCAISPVKVHGPIVERGGSRERNAPDQARRAENA